MSTQNLTKLSIKPIFASPQKGMHQGLYACQYLHDTMDVLQIKFAEWENEGILLKICGKRRKEIINYKSIDHKAAHLEILKERDELLDKLYGTQQIGFGTSYIKDIEDIFKEDFIDGQDEDDLKKKGKAVEARYKFIRLYGLKIAKGLYLVTGGGFKFTRTIGQDAVLINERDRLFSVEAHLEKNNIAANSFNNQLFTV